MLLLLVISLVTTINCWRGYNILLPQVVCKKCNKLRRCLQTTTVRGYHIFLLEVDAKKGTHKLKTGFLVHCTY